MYKFRETDGAPALLQLAIREYAARCIAENYGEDETPAGILTAITEAVNHEEFEHLGRALLVRHETLADPLYRYGEKNYDNALENIAWALGWTP